MIYRHGRRFSLILLLVAGTLAVPYAPAEDDWPEYIDYPPQVNQTKQAAQPKQSKASDASGKEDKPGFFSRLFHKLGGYGRSEEDDLPTEDEIIQVGPREQPAAKDPLLRLPMSVQTDVGLLPPGFYLVQVTAASENKKELTLMRKSRAVTQVVVTRQDVAPGPVEQIEDRPVPIRLEVELSGDKRELFIVLKEGEKQYRSEPLPTRLDERPALAF